MQGSQGKAYCILCDLCDSAATLGMRTIAHISDVHFGTITDPHVVDGLVQDINSRKPTLVVCSGDLTQRARSSQYRAAAEFLKRFEAPVLVVPGNHDIPLFDVVRRFFFPLSNYRKFITNDLRPVHQDEELLVVGVNTARSFTFDINGFWKDGRISEEQLLDVRLRACELPASVLKVVVTHHPFIPPPGERVHGIVHGAQRALDTLEACGVDVLLAGHLHMGYSGDVRTHHEATKRSILSIQAATATSSRRRGEPNAYNWLTLELHHVRIDVRAWNGKRFEPSTVTAFRRKEGIWIADPTESGNK
jgi:3',5'-cyclic AMP phosphodiesterase CpdA